MRKAGKYVMWISATPIIILAAFGLAFLAMMAYGEPTRNAGFVPLFGMMIFLRPAAYAVLPLLMGFALWGAGVLRHEPSRRIPQGPLSPPAP